MTVFRNKGNTWFIPKYIYNETEIWPDFPLVTSIFLHKKTVKKIVNASYYLKKILFMDDVYLGMLLKFSNETLASNNLSLINFNYYNIANLTYVKYNILSYHGVMPGALLYLSSKIYKN